ncbi:2-amino-4-hydroxy-6-hydroxymethyldihydropteridine diphosphokinase [uncultured Muribaculum sp.]|uniref:2-amino-4-hydroxy-6- hydroxymethyldihydropteridine diphosphokinase n=1 Tax=uncultured Muribaculum sp. TaxID=1918613 RepID=UPI0025ECAA22|nr:2-amino-4-hydroxy-6-hydroxymethyldihydropteridine diphosphokinase [uncultured Muribaculum sp.]
MMPDACYINIGSNQGDRRANIARAVALIADRLDTTPLVSDAVESEPWGYSSDAAYLNVGLLVHVDMSPAILLDTLLDIQHAISPAPHRKPDGTYADRIIDIDLIACGQTVADDILTPAGNRLTLPHPRMHLRPFVLIPMLRLSPQWRHPLSGLTPAGMLDALEH